MIRRRAAAEKWWKRKGKMRIGIRREDKNEWEKRAPLTPDHVGRLVKNGIAIWLQPSPIRVFPDDDYRNAGAVISEDLSQCPVILAIKEIPAGFIEPDKAYIFFSHTIKGQKQNMPMLKRMMELRCHIIDYELIADDKGRRLIFFGRYAGLAGMIDTFWAFGKRLAWERIPTPFGDIRMAHEYKSLEDARHCISEVADRIRSEGLPPAISPLICGFAGYGNVSLGAQEIFDLLSYEEIAPSDIEKIASSGKAAKGKIFKVVFKEEDMVEPIDPARVFDLHDYYANPQNYSSRFESYLPHLAILVNCIYWDSRYPRLVTLDYLRRAHSNSRQPPLRVIGDISCDIEGSVQCTVKTTDPGNPVYVYNPLDSTVTDGVEGSGPVVMAVDNLPCELPNEASEFFSRTLIPFIPQLVNADLSGPLENSNLPDELRRAVILYNGDLTPGYEHLAKYL
jgi:alpha-aminoadipic semialdehyde synthase